MWFFILVSWIATILQFCFASMSIASGLYYLAELVEEYPSVACRVIRNIIFIEMGIYICFILFEDMSIFMMICGLLGQLSYLYVMRTFPFFYLTSISFISSIAFLILNHYLAFTYFSQHYHPFIQIMAYFTICLWIVPFSFFVSLSANDYVLPTHAEESRPLFGGADETNDFTSNYFGKRNGKKYGLLGLLKSSKDMILPSGNKKPF